jgi:hypothetical protein
MSEAKKLIYTAIVGFAIWVVQKAISYFVIRYRITQSLLSDIKLNIDQVQEAYDYLKKFEKSALIKGNNLDYIDQFVKTEVSFYQSQISDLPKYYGRKTIDRLSKFYNSFWEIQISIDGLIKYLNHLYECKVVLSQKEMDRATKKLERIYKLAEILMKNKVSSLSDLIDNYEGRLTPDHTL